MKKLTPDGRWRPGALLDKIPIIGWTAVSPVAPRRAPLPQASRYLDHEPRHLHLEQGIPPCPVLDCPVGAGWGPFPNATGQSPRAAVPISNARAEASRRNGARSRGPKTLEGKARAAQNALKHGLRARTYLVLPDEDAAEFAELEAAMTEELAPGSALQCVLARRVAVAAWRLSRADLFEADLFAERR